MNLKIENYWVKFNPHPITLNMTEVTKSHIKPFFSFEVHFYQKVKKLGFIEKLFLEKFFLRFYTQEKDFLHILL